MEFEKSTLKQLAEIFSSFLGNNKIDYFFRVAGYDKFKYDGSAPDEFIYCKLIEINNYPHGFHHVAKVIQIFISEKIFLGKKNEQKHYAEKINKLIEKYNIFINPAYKIAKKS